MPFDSTGEFYEDDESIEKVRAIWANVFREPLRITASQIDSIVIVDCEFVEGTVGDD